MLHFCSTTALFGVSTLSVSSLHNKYCLRPIIQTMFGSLLVFESILSQIVFSFQLKHSRIWLTISLTRPVVSVRIRVLFSPAYLTEGETIPVLVQWSVVMGYWLWIQISALWWFCPWAGPLTLNYSVISVNFNKSVSQIRKILKQIP